MCMRVVEHRDQNGNTPLHHATSAPKHQDLRLLDTLVSAGCDIWKVNANGETLIHHAARYDQEAVVLWLLDKGMSPSVPDKYLNTRLHLAAFYKSFTVFKVLLSHGADLNRVTTNGRTPLHCACEVGRGEVVLGLLDAGADPNKTDRRGHTPLAAAIHRESCDLQTIETLLERTEVDWIGPRFNHLVATATLALRGPNRASTLKRVLDALRTAVGRKKATRIVRRLLPELVPEVLACSDDFDRGSPADVIALLLDYLPMNPKRCHTILFFMLVAVIKHGGDDDGELTRRLLILDESNVTQALLGGWGLQHLCCRYGRLKQLRVLLGLGLSPFSQTVVDGETCTPKSIAAKLSPKMLPHLERILEEMKALGDICRARGAMTCMQ